MPPGVTPRAQLLGDDAASNVSRGVDDRLFGGCIMIQDVGA